MGIFVHLKISKSVTREEWMGAYEESLQLVEAFPLAELREATVQGTPTWCLTPTKEYEHSFGWRWKRLRMGWGADGDYETLRRAENFFLPRDLVAEGEFVDADAPDALFNEMPKCSRNYSWNDSQFKRCYHLWGNKTQGEPYHMYLLAIGCLIAARLESKAYVYGDITKGQCERAVRMANEHLNNIISTPDQCDQDRLLARVAALPLTEIEKLKLYVHAYLGRKDAIFGEGIRKSFSEHVFDEYWAERFQEYKISTVGFDRVLEDYLLWGFDLKKMCAFINFKDDDGTTYYEEFVNRIMDAKLHHQTKDCTDTLKINADEDQPYSTATLFAQFTLAGARNRKIDRYIPLNETRASLLEAIGEKCRVNDLIDEYLQNESLEEPLVLSSEMSDEDFNRAVEQDPSLALNSALRSRADAYKKIREQYDIAEYEDLPYYEAGDTIHPKLLDAVYDSYAFYHSLVSDDEYAELMAKTASDRCLWLSEHNRSMCLRDKDWKKIYDDIANSPESFARYYPMNRVKLDGDDLRSMVSAFVANDDLYSYVSGTVDER